MKNQENLLNINSQIDQIINKATALESDYTNMIENVHPTHRKSALNLIHYLAFRSFDIDNLQEQLIYMGLPDLANIEGHVMKSLHSIQTFINHLNGNNIIASQKGIISIKKSEKLLKKNTKQLFGYKSKKRRTRIMVTLPSTASEDYSLVNHLIGLGMNSARINCAHDDPEVWTKMIENINRSKKVLKRNCKVMMDLGGPKLRTGSMAAGPRVIHIKPQRDSLGNVTKPAKIWIAPPDIPPPGDSADAIIPISELLMVKIKRGNTIHFIDSRDKKCKISIEKKQGKGKWGICSDSAYITTGTELIFRKVKKSGKEKNYVGELLPIEQFITLHIGDNLVLHSDPRPGEPAQHNPDGKLISDAHISCTLPEVFKDVKLKEPVFLNDGKIEGIIEKIKKDEVHVRINYAKTSGSKLKADKGINLPESDLKISGLTVKDKRDLEFVAKWADVVNFSFVNQASDVMEFFEEIEKYKSRPGLILKIETRKGFKNLPEILLHALQTYPVGVMIARGDLAIEVGWKNFASIQEEIMRISEAAHVPVVWATQVLENLAKKGVPTRSEITDAALSQRTECVMLNKGIYIEKTVKTLDKILRRMQKFQKKKQTILPKLEDADKLIISHDRYDV
ncbi:pyruvate kinase [Candidatus Neomarinimicrobiota bacterium]